MKNNTDKPIKWEKEFYKELDNVEATQDNNGIALFGYKVTRDGSEKFTIVDWGGVKQFISQAIQVTREEMIKELNSKYMESDLGDYLAATYETNLWLKFLDSLTNKSEK